MKTEAIVKRIMIIFKLKFYSVRERKSSLMREDSGVCF